MLSNGLSEVRSQTSQVRTPDNLSDLHTVFPELATESERLRVPLRQLQYASVQDKATVNKKTNP